MDERSFFPDSLIYMSEDMVTGESLELLLTKGRTRLWLLVREGRRFILKGLIEELQDHPQDISRLKKEYSLGLRLNHHGVAGVYGFEIHPQTGPVILMEYVDGIPLNEYISNKENEEQPCDSSKEHPGHTVKERIRIALQIADALGYIHSMGMSHRDLKPDNILITRTSHEVKIIDLGLGDSEEFLIHKVSLGTKEYGAPEQQMPIIANANADVYSFGKILELLLPEKKYRKLRNLCLNELPESRPTLDEIKGQLEALNVSNDRRIKHFLIFLVITLSILVLVLLSAILLNNKYTDMTKTVKEPKQVSKIEQLPEKDSENDYNINQKKTSGNMEAEKTGEPHPKSKEIENEETIGVHKEPIDDQPKNTTKKASSEITGKYYRKVEDIIYRYGSIDDDLPLQRRLSQINKRKEEMTEVENQMIKELKEEGYQENEIAKERDAFWFHSITKMNEIQMNGK